MTQRSHYFCTYVRDLVYLRITSLKCVCTYVQCRERTTVHTIESRIQYDAFKCRNSVEDTELEVQQKNLIAERFS